MRLAFVINKNVKIMGNIVIEFAFVLRANNVKKNKRILRSIIWLKLFFSRKYEYKKIKNVNIIKNSTMSDVSVNHTALNPTIGEVINNRGARMHQGVLKCSYNNKKMITASKDKMIASMR